MEPKAGARTAMAALCVLALLSLQQAAPVAAAWDPATFCPCYKQCFAGCHGLRFFCAAGCAKHCITTDTLDAAGRRGGGGGARAALCKIACAAISVCGGSAPAPPAALTVAAADEAACVRDCMK